MEEDPITFLLVCCHRFDWCVSLRESPRPPHPPISSHRRPLPTAVIIFVIDDKRLTHKLSRPPAKPVRVKPELSLANRRLQRRGREVIAAAAAFTADVTLRRRSSDAI
jgi:hypothetical protein